jgi:hypothetical protein
MVLFPVLFLVPLAWGHWRATRRRHRGPGWIAELRLPRLQSRPWIWVPLAVVAIPIIAVLLRGFVEKSLSAVDVLLPGTNLANWSGPALPYLPGPPFFGMPGSTTVDYVGMGVVAALAVLGLRHVRAELRVPMSVMVVGAALVGVYFRLRGEGQLFFFKDLAFLGPYVLILALIGLAVFVGSRARSVVAAGLLGTAAALVVVPIGAARELDGTFAQATPQVLQLAAWDRQIPRQASIRNDVPPSGFQLWGDYMLHDHRLSASVPLGGFFPHPPLGWRADYALTFRPQPRPRDAVGRPVRANAQFELWRVRDPRSWPDNGRRGLIWDVTKITF